MITFLVARIEVEPGWAIGATNLTDTAIDRNVLVDSAEQPWIPGSGLAGSLRSHLRRYPTTDGTTLDTKLMGSRPPQNKGEETEASRLWFLGTQFTPDNGRETAEVVTVGQTAIDRHRSAAAANPLRFSRQVVSGGTLTAYLRFDGVLTDDDLRALAAWRPAIGRDRSTGSGQARLTGLTHGRIDPATDEGLAIWLRHDGPTLVEAVATTPVPVPATTRDPAGWLTATFTIEDGLLIGDFAVAGPAMSRTRGGQPIIPGSTWKGIFRSRVEYIIRSLGSVACDQVSGCDERPVCEVFGHEGSRGLLIFHDSLVTGSTSETRTHVAIDRVTGGARDGQLFTDTPQTGGRVTLRIDVMDDRNDALPSWVRKALLHVVQDLHDGLIGVGARSTRGFGTLRLAEPVELPGPIMLSDVMGRRDSAEKESK